MTGIPMCGIDEAAFGFNHTNVQCSEALTGAAPVEPASAVGCGREHL
jgi:hypothetical protein